MTHQGGSGRSGHSHRIISNFHSQNQQQQQQHISACRLTINQSPTEVGNHLIPAVVRAREKESTCSRT